ncbi:hypothetical protein [Paenibacillus terreus]|uniref:hypothetical protein n=1 Tax=Paenibacillus terreus TaxID=1387834 RepID=UPI0035CCFC38
MVQDNKIVVLVQMFGDVISDVLTFSGEGAVDLAASHFKAWTGISYEDYQERRNNGEDSDDVLGKDYVGTEIYISNPNIPIDEASELGASAVWLFERN